MTTFPFTAIAVCAMTLIVGMRSPRGVFFEMRATAYGVSAIRLLGGFNF